MENTENAGRGWRTIREDECLEHGDEINNPFSSGGWSKILPTYVGLNKAGYLALARCRRPHVSGLGDGWRYLSEDECPSSADAIRYRGDDGWANFDQSDRVAWGLHPEFARRIEQAEPEQPEQQYRFLKAGEVIMEGDETLWTDSVWRLSALPGRHVSSFDGSKKLYRRPLKASEPIELVPTEKAREEMSRLGMFDTSRMTRLERMAAGLEVDVYKQHRINTYRSEHKFTVLGGLGCRKQGPRLTVYGPDLSEP